MPLYTGKYWRVGKHKVLEVEASLHPRAGFWFGMSLEFKDHLHDHSGFYADLSLLWLYLAVQLYDNRHADEYARDVYLAK